jgi:hypothetical protein
MKGKGVRASAPGSRPRKALARRAPFTYIVSIVFLFSASAIHNAYQFDPVFARSNDTPQGISTNIIKQHGTSQSSLAKKVAYLCRYFLDIPCVFLTLHPTEH